MWAREGTHPAGLIHEGLHDLWVAMTLPPSNTPVSPKAGSIRGSDGLVDPEEMRFHHLIDGTVRRQEIEVLLAVHVPHLPPVPGQGLCTVWGGACFA